MQHLQRRLGPDDHATAAAGGLQDSAPRSALLSLHARMEGVDPSSWEHPSLVQTWFRWADYVLPAVDFGLFTRGAMPRDPASAKALEDFASEVVRRLDGDAWRARELIDSLDLDQAGTALRMAAVTGRYRIRWDASTIFVLPADLPEVDVDDEEARLALAQRFLDWYGPATDREFARWAGLTRADAEQTWRSCGTYGDPDRHLNAFEQPQVPHERVVRLLPQGDPWLQLHVDAARTTPAPEVPSKVRNSLTGRILVDGEAVGAWARARGDVTLDAWEPIEDDDRQRVEDEAATFTAPLGLPIRSRWIS